MTGPQGPEQDPRRVQQELAARVAGRANLVDIRMVASQTRLGAFPSGDRPLTWRISTEPTVETHEDLLVVSIAYEVVVVEVAETSDAPEAGREELAVATVGFTLSALYDSMRDLEPLDEELDAYSRTSSTLTLFPYARKFVDDMTGSMGLPRLTMGIWRLPYPGVPAAFMELTDAADTPAVAHDGTAG